MYDFDFTFNSNSLSDPVNSVKELWAKTSGHRRKSGLGDLSYHLSHTPGEAV